MLSSSKPLAQKGNWQPVFDAMDASEKAAQDFLETLRENLKVLYDASEMAKDVNDQPDPDEDTKPTRRGRPRESGRLLFAIKVARAFRDHLNVSPTKTRGGAFASVLSVCLSAASLYHPDDLFDLMKRAIDAVRKV